MKKLIVIIVFVVKWHILFSQENNLVVFFVDAITNGVPVYSNDTCTNSIGIVKEYPEKENWHDVELLGQSKNRYKVRIIAINETNVAPIVGWVEKDQCGVWLHSRYIKPQLFIVELYTKLGQIKPFITLKSKNCYNIDDVDAYSKAVPVFIGLRQRYIRTKRELWFGQQIIVLLYMIHATKEDHGRRSRGLLIIFCN